MMKTFCYFVNNEINFVRAVSRTQAENRMRYNFGSNPPYLFGEEHKIQIIKHYQREDYDDEMQQKMFVIAGKSINQLGFRKNLIPEVRSFNPDSNREDVYSDKPISIGKFISSDPLFFDHYLNKKCITLATLVCTLFFENKYIKV